MNNYISSILESIGKWYTNLKPGKKLIYGMIGVFILFVLVKLLSSKKLSYDIINYNNYNIKELISTSTISTDRLIFLKSEEVINNVFKAYYGDYYINEDKVKVTDFYDYAFFNDYRYDVSKSEFKKNVTKVVTDFKEETGVELPLDLESSSIIGEIYYFKSGYEMYIVKLNLNNSEHYVGIKFSGENKYSIFYFE